MDSLVKKLGQFSIGPIIGAVISFITVPIITYFISPDEYGRASMFTLAISILQMFVFLGMDQAYVKRYYESVDKIKLLTNSMGPSIILVFIIDLFIFFYKENISILLFGSKNEIICVYSLILILPGLAIEKFELMDIRMQQRGFMYSSMTILLKLLVVLCTIGLLILYDKSFRAIVIGTTLAQVIYSVILLIAGRNHFRIKLSLFQYNEMKSLLKFGLPIVPTTIIGWVLSGMDRVMLRAYCDYSELGMYEVAFKVANVLAIVQTCFTSFWVPIAHQWNNENVDKKYFVKMGRLLAFVMTSIFIAVLIFKNLIFLIFANEYNEAVDIIPFLMIYPIMYTISEVTVMGVYFNEKTLNLLIVSAIASIVNIVLNICFIPYWGAVGAAIATGISYVVFFWVRTMISRKIWFRFPIKEYIFVTAMLISSSIINIVVKGAIIYAINIIFLIIVIFYFKNELRHIILFVSKILKKIL